MWLRGCDFKSDPPPRLTRITTGVSIETRWGDTGSDTTTDTGVDKVNKPQVTAVRVVIQGDTRQVIQR